MCINPEMTFDDDRLGQYLNSSYQYMRYAQHNDKERSFHWFILLVPYILFFLPFFPVPEVGCIVKKWPSFISALLRSSE